MPQPAQGMMGEAIISIREQWGVPQAELADLLMTSRRTVRRWEQNQAAPDGHEQWFLKLFVHYVEHHGVPQFRERFVRPGPHFQKRGKPMFLDVAFAGKSN